MDAAFFARRGQSRAGNRNRAANALAKPTVVLFALFPVANANLRHYTFLVQALAEIEEDLRGAERRIHPATLPDHGVAKFGGEVHTALLITDDNRLRGSGRRLARVVRGLRIPAWSVDSDVVVASKLIDTKQYAAPINRPTLLKLRDEFLVRPKNSPMRGGVAGRSHCQLMPQAWMA